MIGELGYTRGCCSRNVLRASAISHQLFLIFPRTDAGKIVSPAVLNASREGLMKKRARFLDTVIRAISMHDAGRVQSWKCRSATNLSHDGLRLGERLWQRFAWLLTV